jgi:hypothetical protein
MARKPRTIIPGLLHEVTIKTFQARFLLTPDGRLNDLVVGVLARAQRLFGLTICAVVVLSNHLHILADHAGDLIEDMISSYRWPRPLE